MKIKLICCVVVLINFFYFSCKERTFDKMTLLIYSNGKIKDTIDGYLSDSTIDSFNKLFQYYDRDTALLKRFEVKIIEEDTILVYNGIKLKKISEKEFFINDKPLKIIKFEYNIPNSADEESYIFFSFELGLIYKNNYPWDIETIVKSEKIPTQLDSILSKDEYYDFFR